MPIKVDWVLSDSRFNFKGVFINDNFCVVFLYEREPDSNMYNYYLLQLTISGKEINKAFLGRKNNFNAKNHLYVNNRHFIFAYEKIHDDQQAFMEQVLYICNDSLEIIDKKQLDARTIIASDSFHDKINAILQKDDTLIFEQYDTNGTVLVSKVLATNSKYSEVCDSLYANNGSFILNNHFNREESKMKKYINPKNFESEGEYYKAWLQNDIADCLENTKQTIYILKISNTGEISDLQLLRKDSYDAPMNITPIGNGKLLMGTILNFLQDNTSYEFCIIDKHGNVEQTKHLEFSDEFGQYSGSFAPNFKYNEAGNNVIQLVKRNGRLAVCELNVDTLEISNYCELGSHAYQFVSNEKNNYFILYDSSIAMLHYESGNFT